MRRVCRRGAYGKDKREGGRKLHQAMNGAPLGHGVYGRPVVGQTEGDEMSLKITMRLYQSIFLIVLVDLHLYLQDSFISSTVYEGP